MSTLRLENLSAGYHQRLVLKHFSLTVHGGEVVALVGPNGAGKSTLMRVVSGVLPAQAGAVWLDDQNLLRLSPAVRAQRLAVVPQQARLPEAFTVGEIVLMGRTPHLPLWAGEGAHDEAIAWQALRRVQAEALAPRRVGELSGGEQQRVVLARALAQEPQVLLLDEPTAHLDLKHQCAVLALVRSLAQAEGLAVLLTLHDLNQAALYADRVALLQQGALVAVGPPAEVLTPERLSALYDVPITIGTHPRTGGPVVFAG